MPLLHLLRARRPTSFQPSLRFLLIAVGLAFALPSLPAAAQQEAYFDGGENIPTSNLDWMRWLPDSTHLATLTVPGTYESMTDETEVYDENGNPLYPLARRMLNQRVELLPQLNAGIRALSVTVRIVNGKLKIYYDGYFLMGSFDEVLSTVTEFLKQHPFETVLLRVKEEYTEDTTYRPFKETLEQYYATGSPYEAVIWRGTTLPSLREVRGKIVLLHDFGATRGIPLSNNSAVQLSEQAWPDTVDEKWRLVRNHLDAASSGAAATLYVNELSAQYEELGLYRADFASSINDNTLDYLNGSNVQRAGVLLMDFPGPGLINALIAKNFRHSLFSVPTDNGRRTNVGSYLQPGLDRPGMDFDSVELDEARPELCRETCLKKYPTCKSFNYVSPGVGGATKARCWRKYCFPPQFSS
ncbi:phosphatidylinositol-specific phospholipase C domain-containing protein [Archangium sp.]|uniref:phosphatidylinositol-specific phospholipase C domain-containing protein n=1 Tax=Archangium sp. TaxID=1872627 RepID=UPI002D7245DC|nr:phosphatidylinositol-specific phospholipase C domain-containing protein [Archangium sp.]HYO54148.1 phosphatidylinositol-specific phospholipase C domain-containing protein [Archangium sp.]